METKGYDLTSFVNMISSEYDLQEIVCSLDDVLHHYIIARMESGECGHQDAVNVSIVKDLIRVFLCLQKS